ncbi:cellulase family glycosylhydrolase [Demequina soli]|uniref:cellulase family glycosylhydrolase n=1 Tax=Demequina soli TaxID=1638987 RepID=UPI000781A93F|nr:cellulase family glycosylhydrolase [Demequina soli]
MDVRTLVERVPGGLRAAAAAVGIVAASVGGVLSVSALARDDAPAPTPTASPSAAARAVTPSPSTTPSATPSPSTTVRAEEPACTAALDIRDAWEGGYTATITVTAAVALDTWTVSVDVGSSVVSGAWNTTLAAGDTGRMTAGPVDWNGALAAGTSTEVGFTADGGAPAAADLPCTGGAEATASPAPAATGASSPAAVAPAAAGDGDDWLRADGARIVDLEGHDVRMTGASWFGFNTSARVLHGLWTADMDAVLDQVARRGINTLRVPVSTELLLEWRAGRATISGSVNQAGPQAGMTTLEVFDAFLAGCKARGVKVILDVHSALADDNGHMAPMWFAGAVTSADFVDAWEWVARRYREDDTIVAFDLENEPHGKAGESPRATWGGGTASGDWRAVAQDLALRILAIHPNVLVLVEGVESYPRAGGSWASTDPADYDTTWWGGNLRGAAEHPVDLGRFQDRLVYSPHEYGPLVYEQPWFRSAFSRDSLERDVWEPHWLYLDSEGIAPVLIGEWGGRLGQDERQDRWMTAVRDLIVERGLSHTFWCVNPNSSDTGGLLLDDWATWDEDKYALLEPALWQDDAGRFVSLDHEVPLPGGITVAQYYAG